MNPSVGLFFFLIDRTAEDLHNALDLPLEEWAPYEAFYGRAPPNSILSKDSAVAL